MPVPDFQSIMLPFLMELRDGQERAVRELTGVLSEHFQLTEADRQQLLPSGEQTLFSNRVAWTKTHLKNAGLIENPTRGKVRIAEAGLKVLAQKPSNINCRYLKQFPSYLSFIGQGTEKPVVGAAESEAVVSDAVQTPQELIESSYHALRKATTEELLDRLKACSPGFFEIVVVRLLQALGYGATGEALVTGKSGDGGIDGVIREDKLGLDVVCVQAKRWTGRDSVGRPEVQAFVGSMDLVRAKKGVVITTANFSRDARDFVDRIEGKKVVLIDGITLASYMIEYNVGVNVTKRYELKEVSDDFFEEDEG